MSFSEDLLILPEDKENLFLQFASVEQKGRKFMTPDDFLECYGMKGMVDPTKFKVFFNIVDRNGSGLIDFNDFIQLEKLLTKPDSDYEIAFKLFDDKKSGFISKDEIVKVMQGSEAFDTNSDIFDLFFGKDGNAKLNYPEFTIFLRLLEAERVKQLFTYYAKGSGQVSGEVVKKIITQHKHLPAEIRDVLNKVATQHNVNFAEFVAFNNFLRQLDDIVRIAERAYGNKHSGSINKEDYIKAASETTPSFSISTNITPMEVDFLFRLFPETSKDGKVNPDKMDVGKFLSIMNARKKQIQNQLPPQIISTQVPEKAKQSNFAAAVVNSVKNFGLGAIAGGIGAFTVYPIDLVKTRMQNQRTLKSGGGPVMYKNSFDCFAKVFRNEGILGFYKGLGPQLIGVAPEKAIKLTVNDLLRDMFTNKEKSDIYFPLEVLAGAGAGASQVVFTNPLEIVKIRLQVSALNPASKVTTMNIIRDLGFFGLYKGAGACLLRDIPFSAIYFPTYAKMKLTLMDEDGKLGPQQLLLAGAVAGIPAASLVTPADVIKTRLQVQAKQGEQTYTGIRDCFWKVLTQEGPTALFKGCAARVFRSSPQFGVTLLSYELLQRFLAPSITPRPPTNVPVTERDFESLRVNHVGQVQNRVSTLEQKWGGLFTSNNTAK